MNTVYIATDALVAEQQALTNLSTDLANAQTPGFLALVTANLGDPIGVLSRVGGTAGTAAQPAPLAPVEPQGVAAETVWSTAPGAIQQTGIAADIAISNGGFLAVHTPGGVAYTRNGTLHVSPQGLLVTAYGQPVLSRTGTPIRLTPGRAWTVSPTGVVTQAGRVPQPLQIVTLQAPVTDLGDTLYQGTVRPWAGTVTTGALTASNVSLDTTLTNLMEAQSSYDANAAVFNEEGTRLQEMATLAQWSAPPA